MSQSTFDTLATTVIVILFGGFILLCAYFVLEGQKDSVWCEAKGGTHVRIDGEFFCITDYKTIEITR